MRLLLSGLCFFVFALFSMGQNKTELKKIVQVKGYAPAYVGQQIIFSEIEDYISMHESPLASATVGPDSSFSVSFFATETQKIILHAHKNISFLYIQPGSFYELYIPEKDKYEPYRPEGNNIEITFLDLDSLDINFRILQFQRWMDEAIGSYYYLKNVKPLEFAAELDKFKLNVEKTYKIGDTIHQDNSEANRFFKTFVRFSIASIDNIQYAADRNRYEKHDFYIKYAHVDYKNDAYMGYLNAFYDKMIPRLSMETNNRVYLGLLKSSPTLIMKALGSEYTLINMRIRELVMIKALSEEFYSKDFPQTNILLVLDSVANHSLFDANSIIAKNMINRLTELVAGGRAPDFVVTNEIGEKVVSSTLPKKHVYIHFYDPTSVKSTIELEPLKKLYSTYKDDVTFITVYPAKDLTEDQQKLYVETIPWQKFKADDNNSIWKNYKVLTFPSYVLLDGYGYVVAAPALSPMPDGQYQTIDKTFFYIHKTNEELKK